MCSTRPFSAVAGVAGVAGWGGVGAAEHVAGARVQDGRQRRVLGPGGGGVEGGREQLPAAFRVALREDGHGEPAPDARPQRLPPNRLAGVERGERFQAVVDDHGEILLPPGQLGPHERHPAVDVDLAAPGQGVAGDLVKLGPGAVELTGPRPDDGEPGLDVGQVAPGAELAADGDRLLEGGDRRGVVGPQIGQVGQDGEHQRGPPPLAQRAELTQRDPELFLHAVEPPHLAGVHRAVEHPHRPQPRVTGGRVPVVHLPDLLAAAVELQQQRLGHGRQRMQGAFFPRPLGDPGDALGELLLDRLDVVRPARRQHRADHPALGRRLGRRVGRGQREHLAGQRVALAVPELHPVVAQGPDEPERRARVSAGDRPAQRCVHVVLLGREQVEPAHLAGGAQQRVGGLGQLAEVAREHVPGRGRLPRLRQPFQGVGAHRLEHPVARGAVVGRLRHRQDRLADQARERGQDLGPAQSLAAGRAGRGPPVLRRRRVGADLLGRRVGADLLGRGQRGAAGEDREAAGERALGF